MKDDYFFEEKVRVHRKEPITNIRFEKDIGWTFDFVNKVDHSRNWLFIVADKKTEFVNGEKANILHRFVISKNKIINIIENQVKLEPLTNEAIMAGSLFSNQKINNNITV